MIKELKIAARHTVAVALSLTLIMTPLAANAEPDDTIGGVLVKEPTSTLPVPDVAMASDGRSLVVWNDSESFFGSIVSADGITVGAPFLVSGVVPVDEYGGNASVAWNDDRSEWLVVFTSDYNGHRGVYAQRISTTGSLTGALVPLPKDAATAFGAERISSSVVQIGGSSNRPSQASATWSSEHEVYLVTWRLGASAELLSPLGLGDTNSGLLGYFMTGELASADGIDAAFVLQGQPDLATWQALAKQEYSEELDKWAFIWSGQASTDSDQRIMRMTTLTFQSGIFVVDPSIQVVNPRADSLNYADSLTAGDIVWVRSLNAWVVSWGAKPNAGDNWNGFARTIAPDGTLGAPVQVSNFGLTSRGGAVAYIHNQDLAYDSTAGVVYAAAHLNSSAESGVAALWRFRADNLAPIEWQEFISPRTSAAGDLSMNVSYRPKISESDGNVALVYQNFPTGVSSQVRYHLAALATPPPAAGPEPEPDAPRSTTGPSVSAPPSAINQRLPTDEDNDSLFYTKKNGGGAQPSPTPAPSPDSKVSEPAPAGNLATPGTSLGWLLVAGLTAAVTGLGVVAIRVRKRIR